eukprot:IDg5417t1
MRSCRWYVAGLDSCCCKKVPTVEVERLPEEPSHACMLKWLCEGDSGVFLVRLLGGSGLDVDHVVVVDKRKRLVIDCVEKFPLSFSEASFEACVGDDAALKYN